MAGTLALRMSDNAITSMQAVIDECSLGHLNALSQVQAMMRMAAGVKQLRQLITNEAMSDIMELQNTALGFRTDKPQGYPVEVVKDVTIEASLRGLRMVGNEVNIISGRMYITREGFARLVREYSGLTDLKLTPAVPRLKDGGALVTFRATWNLDGKPQSLERDFPVRVNNGMGSDAIIGKATRKMLAAIYGQLTGSEHALPDGEVGDAFEQQPRTTVSTLNDSLSSFDRPQTTDEPEAPLLDRARETFAGLNDATAVDYELDQMLTLAGDEPTRTAMQGLAGARKKALGKK